MKFKEIIRLLGLRSSRVRTFGYLVKTFDLPNEGRVEYAQWLHPKEGPKSISQECVDHLRTFLRPGDVALDIGAHSGDSTIPIALAVGQTGWVFALEPNPYIFPVLRRNSELNLDKTRILPLMLAATPSAGDYVFNYSDNGFCNGGLHPGISRWRHAHTFSLRVQGMNVQSFLAEEHPDLCERLRFIKVDAEGFDHTVLTTLSDLITRHKPYIKAEVFRHSRREQREDFYRFIAGHGYQIHRVQSESDYLGPVLNLDDMMKWQHFDIFCVPSVGERARGD